MRRLEENALLKDSENVINRRTNVVGVKANIILMKL